MKMTKKRIYTEVYYLLLDEQADKPATEMTKSKSARKLKQCPRLQVASA